MNWTVVAINLIALVALAAVIILDKKRAVKALKIAAMSFLKMLPMVLSSSSGSVSS